MKRVFTMLVMWVLLCSCGFSQGTDASLSGIVTDPSHAAISNAKVTVNMTYMVGSRHEGYGETGMAHLLEHILFLKTKTRENVTRKPITSMTAAARTALAEASVPRVTSTAPRLLW